jgi:predicted CXXCH cytochrome family protein
MKKTKKIRHLTLSLFVLIVFLCSFLFPIKPFISRAADNPAFVITSPLNNAYFSQNNVNFSGTFSLGTNPDTVLTATALDTTDPDDTPSAVTIGTNTWTFSKNFDSVGWHKITFNATFKDTVNETEEKITTSIWIMITADRPIVTDFILTSQDHVGNQTPWVDSDINNEDINHVPLDAQIKIKVHSNNGLKFNTTKPIIVEYGNETVESNELYQIPPDGSNGDYIITFTPKPNGENPGLVKNTNYKVMITTDIVDNNEKPIYPKTFQFTTTSTIDPTNPDGTDNENNPHGSYTNNTNTCAFCHSTHKGLSSSLEGGRYIESENNDPMKSYCLACHDGTTAAPIANGFDKNLLHSHPDNLGESGSSQNELKQTGTCTSCHNPHSGWSKDNPNMLKNHIIYTSTIDNTKKDSLDVPCQSCHDENGEIASKDYQHSYIKDLLYKKSSTAIGNTTTKEAANETDVNKFTIGDYSLCLRCHNIDKKNDAADIETLYLKDKTESGHFIALPDGKTTQNDGSKLKGPLPCAECHETHGSNNIKLLKSKIGHENQNSQDFSAPSGEWKDLEKTFCLKCHGTNQTAVYGVYSKPISANHDIDTGTGKTEPCAKCHSNSYNPDNPMAGFIESAHAPQRKQQVP